MYSSRIATQFNECSIEVRIYTFQGILFTFSLNQQILLAISNVLCIVTFRTIAMAFNIFLSILSLTKTAMRSVILSFNLNLVDDDTICFPILLLLGTKNHGSDIVVVSAWGYSDELRKSLDGGSESLLESESSKSSESVLSRGGWLRQRRRSSDRVAHNLGALV